MIYEIATYDLRPGTLDDVEKKFGAAYEQRRKLSAAAAFWHTELGPLNQIVQIWPYADLAERQRVVAEVERAGTWPPDIGEAVVKMRSDLMIPFPFAPEMPAGDLGPCFEMRTYVYLSGHLPRIMALWERALPPRRALSPLCGLWYSELADQLYFFVHIWSYRSLDERNAVRDKAKAAGIWPPLVYAKKEEEKYTLLSQENRILMPAAYSPLR